MGRLRLALLLCALSLPVAAQALDKQAPPPPGESRPEYNSSRLSDELARLYAAWKRRGTLEEARGNPFSPAISGNRVAVMIVASSERAAHALYQDLPREGIEVTAHYQAWLDAWVPVEKLPLLADMPGVTYVKAQIPVMPMEGRGD